MKKLYKILFSLILVLAFITRFRHLDTLPPSLNWDEISHGYNAYSLLLTGKDQWGIANPIFNFRAYGDYPTTLNLYLSIPFIKFLGLNSLSIRLPSAIFGFLFITFIYLFTRLIFNNTPLALFAMFLATISPWSLFPSRAVFQSNFSQLLLLAGLYFFLAALKKPRLFLISAFTFGLSMYSYHNAKIIVPLLVPALIYFNFPAIKKIFIHHRPTVFISLILFLILTVPNLINLFSPQSLARNQWVGIINTNSINIINEKRRLFIGPPALNRLVNNKVIYFSQNLLINYLNLLNPIPLFFQGTQNNQFNPPQTPLLYPLLLPFFYLGLLKAITSRQKVIFHRQLLILFLICLLPSALTVGDFPSIRATSALPFYFIFIILGLSQLKALKSKLIPILIVAILTFNFLGYISIYQKYNQDFSSAWQYGYQQVVDYTKSHYSQYSQIYITKKYGEPHEFVLFYWPWNPADYQTDPHLNWNYHASWYWVDGFDKFTFINDWQIDSLDIPLNTLLITSPGNYPPAGARLQTTVNFLDGLPAFDIVSYD